MEASEMIRTCHEAKKDYSSRVKPYGAAALFVCILILSVYNYSYLDLLQSLCMFTSCILSAWQRTRANE